MESKARKIKSRSVRRIGPESSRALMTWKIVGNFISNEFEKTRRVTFLKHQELFETKQKLEQEQEQN